MQTVRPLAAVAGWKCRDPRSMQRPVSQFRFLTRTNSIPTEYFVLANLKAVGPVVGHLAGEPIRDAVLDEGGRRYRFAGVMRAPRPDASPSKRFVPANGSCNRA